MLYLLKNSLLLMLELFLLYDESILSDALTIANNVALNAIMPSSSTGIDSVIILWI